MIKGFINYTNLVYSTLIQLGLNQVGELIFPKPKEYIKPRRDFFKEILFWENI